MKKVILAMCLLFILPLTCSAMSIGIISDIHAGSQTIRQTSRTTVYPSIAISYFENAVRQMKSKGVSLIISLGDNTNSGEIAYYQKLKGIENKYGIKILWVRGNHDNNNFNILAPNNYSYSIGGKTFRIVDDNHCGSHCFPKKMDGIILQHIPPFSQYNCDWRSSFLHEKGNTIFAGHWHQAKTCGKVRLFPALTTGHKLNYTIVNL